MDVSTASSVKPLLGVLDAAADLLRAGAILSIVLAPFVFPWSALAIFIAVFVVMLVPRIAGLPRPVDLAVGITWLLAGWANVAGWYTSAGWVDWIIHGVATAASAGALYLLLVRIAVVPPLQERDIRRTGVVLLTLALGMAIGVLWEFYEWIIYSDGPKRDLVGYDDTIADLLMDTIGSLVVGLGLALWASMGWGTRRLPLRQLR